MFRLLQLLLAMAASLGYLTIGLVRGFSSPGVPSMQHLNPELVPDEQAVSWVSKYKQYNWHFPSSKRHLIPTFRYAQNYKLQSENTAFGLGPLGQARSLATLATHVVLFAWITSSQNRNADVTRLIVKYGYHKIGDITPIWRGQPRMAIIADLKAIISAF